jgi:hypothetical protein
MNKIKDILRWVFLLPLSIMLGVLMLFVLHIILINTFREFITPYPELPERLLSPFVFSLGFVISGSKVAPKFKIQTSVFLFFLLMLLASSLVWSLSNNVLWFGKSLELEYGGAAFYLSILGSFLGLFYVLKKYNNSEYDSSDLFKHLLPNVIFYFIFLFCVFHPTFRIVFFVLYFILILYFLKNKLKNIYQSTFAQKLKILYEIIFAVALLIGIVKKDLGLLVSNVCLILITFSYAWDTLNFFKKMKV